jgi:hypothetical protein
MKNRFTAGQAKEESNGPPGLHRPIPVQEAPVSLPPPPPTDKKEENETKEEEPKPITVRRTVQPFTPHPLVCKRFGVAVPHHMGGVAVAPPVGRVTEADYFEKEVLAVRNQSSMRQNAQSATPKEKNTTSVEERNHKTEEESEAEGPTGVPRPPMEKLKSIYEPESEESSDPDTDLDSIDDENGPTQHDGDDDDRKEQASEMTDDQLVKKHGGQPDSPRDTVKDSQVVVYEAQRVEGEMVEYEKSSSLDDSSSQHKERKRKHRRKERHRRRKRSRSPDDSGSSGDRKRKKERRRKHEKKRHKKSSHRKRHKES